MFGLLDMIDNYEERVVAHSETEHAIVDTAAVTDSDQPYETGVSSVHYNDGKWVIVELYDTREEAETGHAKWAALFGGAPSTFPDTVSDVNTCDIGFFSRDTYTRK